jgi:hypothetical protein
MAHFSRFFRLMQLETGCGSGHLSLRAQQSNPRSAALGIASLRSQ